jgi:hypothetical protein
MVERELVNNRCPVCGETPQRNIETRLFTCACPGKLWERECVYVEGTRDEKERFARSGFQEERTDDEGVSYFHPLHHHRIWLHSDNEWFCDKRVEDGSTLSQYLDWFDEQSAIARSSAAVF